MKKLAAPFLSADSQEIQAQPNSLHNHPAIQVERSDSPDSLLKAEQERTRQLKQELLTVRSALKQMDELQSELAVERETGKQLVKFLEEAEREARKVPVLEQLLSQQDNAEHTVLAYLARKEPIAQQPGTP
jgi:DNA repair exonuclease SbcCD ATPase subunit